MSFPVSGPVQVCAHGTCPTPQLSLPSSGRGQGSCCSRRGCVQAALHGLPRGPHWPVTNTHYRSRFPASSMSTAVQSSARPGCFPWHRQHLSTADKVSGAPPGEGPQHAALCSRLTILLSPVSFLLDLLHEVIIIHKTAH